MCVLLIWVGARANELYNVIVVSLIVAVLIVVLEVRVDSGLHFFEKIHRDFIINMEKYRKWTD